MTDTVWTIERLIKAEFVKLKDEPTVDGIHIHDTIWVPNKCTLNVFQDGYHEFVHYIYKNIHGEMKFACARSNECEENESTFFNPVMEDKSIDVHYLLNLTIAIEELEEFVNEPTFKLNWKKLMPLLIMLGLAGIVLYAYLDRFYF